MYMHTCMSPVSPAGTQEDARAGEGFPGAGGALCPEPAAVSQRVLCHM